MKRISEMSRDELIRLIVNDPDNIDIEVLKQALDRIDALDGIEKTEADILIEAINDDSFDALPLEKQLEKLMQATQALIDQAKKSGREL